MATGSGMPVLRHDWFTLSGRAQLVQFTLSTLAWQPNGIGSPRDYPTDFFFAAYHTILGTLFGTHVALFFLVASAAALCVYGARAIGSLEANDAYASFALVLFALFNPWVYVKLVEGHVAMIAAYGALMALIAELWRPRTRWIIAALLMAPMAQLQFFVLGMFACSIAAIARREKGALLPIACGIVFVMPSIAGFAFDATRVASIPYNLDWQRDQSIAPVDAAALTGFFTHYTSGFGPVTFDAIWALAALAIVGLATRRRSRRTLVLLTAGLGAWALATGTKGPLADVYGRLLDFFPPIELYRELYDLLALLAIAYLAAASVATARYRAFGICGLLAGLVLVASWILAPPSRWWIHRSELPALTIDAPADSRFALYPDVQPLRFGRRGSGIDPEAFPRWNDVSPLNGGDTPYPATTALRLFARTGDTRSLQAVGVSRIYERPWLESDLGSASAVSATGPYDQAYRVPPTTRSIAPRPKLSLLEGISVSRNLPEIGSGRLFFADLAGLSSSNIPASWKTFRSIDVLVPSRRLKGSDDWVDVRTAFPTQPQLGEAFGGAFTTSHTSVLRIDSSKKLLAYVSGTLRTIHGRTLSRSTRGYEWISVPRGSDAVTCDGECAAIAQGSPPDLLPAPARATSAIPLRQPLPWFAWATIPARSSATILTYLVGYDRSMIAITSTGTLPHVRVETVFNGWFVKPHLRPTGVLLVDVLAVAQVIFETIACIVALALAIVVVMTGRHTAVER